MVVRVQTCFPGGQEQSSPEGSRVLEGDGADEDSLKRKVKSEPWRSHV